MNPTDEINIPEIEADGFITRAEDLERTSMRTAKPAEKCIYPRCEDCRNYVRGYCTVPMVITKQTLRLYEDLVAKIDKLLTELENLVTDEILRSEWERKLP